MRSDTAEALGKIGDKRAVKPLMQALGDQDSSMRRLAVRVLGGIADKRAVEPLIRALADEHLDVLWLSADALGRIGEPALRPCIETLRDKNRIVFMRAAVVRSGP